MDKTVNLRYISVLTVTAALGGLLFGYDTGVISGTIESLDRFFVIPAGYEGSAAHAFKGFLVSSALIGCVIGGFFGGVVSKKWGRKKGLIIAAVLFLVSAIGSSAPEIFFRPIGEGDHTFAYFFVFYRILGGIGVGLASMLSPLYISEIAPAKSRGRLVSMNQLAIVFGFVVVYFVNYFIAKGNSSDEWLNTVGWRWMFASEAIPAVLFLSCLFFVPDTPRALMLRSKPREAMDILTKINGENEGKAIMESIKKDLVTHSDKLFSYGWFVIVMGIVLAALQQFVGINVVLYYAPEIFKKISSEEVDGSLLLTIFVGIVNLVFTFIAIKTVDKYGRKPLMIIGATGMAIAMLFLGFLFYAEGSGYLALLCMMVYIGSFAMSWGPVVWVLLSEIFPNKIRGQAMAIAVAVQWISNYVVSFTFPVMDDNEYLVEYFNHGFAYWVYGLMAVFSLLFVKYFVPETKGKTLEEMERLWQNERKS